MEEVKFCCVPQVLLWCSKEEFFFKEKRFDELTLYFCLFYRPKLFPHLHTPARTPFPFPVMTIELVIDTSPMIVSIWRYSTSWPRRFSDVLIFVTVVLFYTETFTCFSCIYSFFGGFYFELEPPWYFLLVICLTLITLDVSVFQFCVGLAEQSDRGDCLPLLCIALWVSYSWHIHLNSFNIFFHVFVLWMDMPG